MAQTKAYRLDDATVDMIDTLAESRESTATAVIKSAIRTEAALQNWIRNGDSVIVKRKNGETRELVFMHMEA